MRVLFWIVLILSFGLVRLKTAEPASELEAPICPWATRTCEGPRCLAWVGSATHGRCMVLETYRADLEVQSRRLEAQGRRGRR